MNVAATVPGGQNMTVNVNGQEMSVTVPPGIQPGQNFTFAVAAPPPQQPIAMAQPVPQPVAMAQPVMAQPMVAQGVPMQQNYGQPNVQPATVVIQPAMPQQQQVVHVHHTREPGEPPYGCPPGGVWVSQPYCGDTTMIALILTAIFFPYAVCCVPCCKCDQRNIYIAPDGTQYLHTGNVAPPDCCVC